MKLDDFLKCKKVRLLTDGYTNLNKGSEYNLVRLEVVISNNAGIEGRYPLDDFEPVTDLSKSDTEIDTMQNSVDVIDWSKAPKGYDWWAKDKDGVAYWFDDLPRKQGDCWGGPCNFEETTIYLNDKPWHESLERRPKSEQVPITGKLNTETVPIASIDDLHPEFEALANHVSSPSNDDAPHVSQPKFKAGDPVYFPRLSNKLCVIGEGQEDDYVDEVNGSKALAEMQSDLDFVYSQRIKSWVWNKIDAACPLIHATPENHALLSQLQPHIEFERPLTQADIDNEAVDKLAQAMKNKLAKKREQGYHGWETCKHGDLVQLLINHVDKGDPIDVANFCAFLFARGEPLTQAVLDE